MSQAYWNKEYEKTKHIPSSRTNLPSKAVVWFEEHFIASGKVSGNQVLDIGSGNGRNAVYLGRKGFTVHGIELSDYAVELAKQFAETERVSDQIVFTIGDIGEKLPFSPNSFDLVIDMMTLHLLTPSQREVYIHEVNRLLAPGGYFLFYTIDAESPAAQELFKTSPGIEPNSYIITQTGITEKGFTKDELTKMFNKFVPIDLTSESHISHAFGGEYERVYIRGVFEKIKS